MSTCVKNGQIYLKKNVCIDVHKLNIFIIHMYLVEIIYYEIASNNNFKTEQVSSSPHL